MLAATKKLTTRIAASNSAMATRTMAGKAAFNWRDPLHLEAQLTDEELMIKVSEPGAPWNACLIRRSLVLI